MQLDDFSLQINEGQNSVDYYLYKDTRPIKEQHIPFPDGSHRGQLLARTNTGSRACFVSLQDLMKQAPLNNRMCYEFSDENCRVKLDDVKRKQWLLLSKANGFLPKYTSVKYTLANGKFVIDLSDCKTNELYVYLTTMRSMVAEPNHVSNLLKLINIFSFDYFTATLVAAQLSYGNNNHHFLPTSCFSYPRCGNISNITISTSLIKAIVLFIKSLNYGFSHSNHWSGFNCNNTIKAMSNSEFAQKGAEVIDIDDNLNVRAAKVVRETLVQFNANKNPQKFIRDLLD